MNEHAKPIQGRPPGPSLGPSPGSLRQAPGAMMSVHRRPAAAAEEAPVAAAAFAEAEAAAAFTEGEDRGCDVVVTESQDEGERHNDEEADEEQEEEEASSGKKKPKAKRKAKAARGPKAKSKAEGKANCKASPGPKAKGKGKAKAKSKSADWTCWLKGSEQNEGEEAIQKEDDHKGNQGDEQAAKRRRTKRTTVVPGFDEQGEALPTEDSSGYSREQKWVFDKILPDLPAPVADSYRKAVNEKDHVSYLGSWNSWHRDVVAGMWLQGCGCRAPCTHSPRTWPPSDASSTASS